MVNALTFDVEEYFHAETFSRVVDRRDWPILESRVVSATERVLEILTEARTVATFFVLGWVAERYPALVRAIRRGGHEVACHGYGHQMITRLGRGDFAEDVRRGKAAVEDAAGVAVVGYRAPTFSVVRDTLWSLEILADAGFRYDSSIFPIVHDRYGIPDSPRFLHRRATGAGGTIWEFPPSTIGRRGWRLPVAGGGYFRLLPYAATRRALRHLNEVEGQPAMVYLHPWELDPGQPRLPIGRLAQLRHSLNTSRTEGKLRRLLSEFRFQTVRDVLDDSSLQAEGAVS
jgi:polysaccharide deacetylase family protein (PEP-CTERM system associated)